MSERRQFLITLAGRPLGHVTMASDRPRSEDGEEPAIHLITPPVRSESAGCGAETCGGWFLLWTEVTDSGGEVMIWNPTTPEEVEDATAFYELATRKPKAVSKKPKRAGKLPDWLREMRNPKPENRTDEERRLIEDIVANPDDDEIRFRYADWLTARGSPQGEFIRIDTQLERMADDDPAREPLNERWIRLMEEYGEDFVAPLRKFGLTPRDWDTIEPQKALSCGVIRRIQVDKKGILPRRMDALFEVAPFIDDVTLDFERVPLEKIVTHPRMAQVRRLEVGVDGELTPKSVAALASSPHTGRLNELDLSYAGTDLNAATPLLVETAFFSRLTSLSLSGWKLGVSGAAVLAAADRFDSLKELNLRSNELEPDSLAALLRCRSLAKLESLDLSSNPGVGGALPAIAQAAFLDSLRALELSGCRLRGSAAALGKARFRNLESLDLGSNRLNDADFEGLCAAKWFARLKTLQLSSSKESQNNNLPI